MRRGFSTTGRDLEPKPRRCEPHLERASTLPHGDPIRFRSKHLAEYMQSLYIDRRFEGWCDFHHVYVVGYLSRAQHQLTISGSVGEIGVHHGKFTVAISGFATQTESTVAVDLFSLQAENTDRSGLGDLTSFKDNMKKFGVLEGVSILEGNSYGLSYRNFSKFPAFRLMSVDGGHTHSLTLNDLLLTCELILDGGIVILDDFVRTDWLGVSSGAFDFIRSQNRIVPFLWLSNKLYFTTDEFHSVYISTLKQISLYMCENGASTLAATRGVFPKEVCVVDCEEEKVAQLCDLMSSPNSVIELYDLMP